MATTVGLGAGRMQSMAMSSCAALSRGTLPTGIPSATNFRGSNSGNRRMLSATNLHNTGSGSGGIISPANVSSSFKSRIPVVMAQGESKETVAVEEEKQEVEKQEVETVTPDVAVLAGSEWATSEPRRFHVRSDQIFNVLSSSLSLPFRLGSGALVKGYKLSFVPVAEFPPDRYASFEIAGRKVVETGSPNPRPEKPIELYEFEGCPFCRKVREIVNILDLDVLYYPTPRNGPNFRPKAIQMGGKQQFPYMVDPNTGESMYESDNIIKYLVDKYGDGKVPLALSLGPITTITASLAMIGRLGKGMSYTPSRVPAKPLQLWAYEPSPFCKLVREKLVELELPHYYYSTPRGSEKRNELFQRIGHFQVPYLEDPNTGVKMFESADIVKYLQQTYAISAPA